MKLLKYTVIHFYLFNEEDKTHGFTVNLLSIIFLLFVPIVGHGLAL